MIETEAVLESQRDGRGTKRQLGGFVDSHGAQPCAYQRVCDRRHVVGGGSDICSEAEYHGAICQRWRGTLVLNPKSSSGRSRQMRFKVFVLTGAHWRTRGYLPEADAAGGNTKELGAHGWECDVTQVLSFFFWRELLRPHVRKPLPRVSCVFLLVGLQVTRAFMARSCPASQTSTAFSQPLCQHR